MCSKEVVRSVSAYLSSSSGSVKLLLAEKPTASPAVLA